MCWFFYKNDVCDLYDVFRKIFFECIWFFGKSKEILKKYLFLKNCWLFVKNVVEKNLVKNFLKKSWLYKKVEYNKEKEKNNNKK